MRAWFLVGLLLGLVPAIAGAQPTACAPGAQVACACPGGTAGVQVCAPDGSHFQPCQCYAPPPVYVQQPPVYVQQPPGGEAPPPGEQPVTRPGKPIAELAIGSSLIALAFVFGGGSAPLWQAAFGCDRIAPTGGASCAGGNVVDAGALAGAVVLDSLSLGSIIVGPILLASGIRDYSRYNRWKKAHRAVTFTGHGFTF